MSARPTLMVRELGLVPYREALALQGRLVEERREGKIPDTLLLLEHPHVITVGSGGAAEHLLVDEAQRRSLGIELHEAGRGGDVTYHGPGQLVGYPILDLKPDRTDLHRYLRDLEEVLIRTLGRFGLQARRAEGFTGVWVEGRKIAAIGVRVSSGWITSHGFALNVSTDLGYFGTIVPCGIHDREVTSIAAEWAREGRPGSIDPAEVRTAVVEATVEVFGREPAWSASSRPRPHGEGRPQSDPAGGSNSK